MLGVNNDGDRKLGTGDQRANIVFKVKGQYFNEQAFLSTPVPVSVDALLRFRDCSEVFFRMTRCTRLKNLMHVYCGRQRLDFVTFLFDGRVIRGEETPHELGIEEGDEIDAVFHCSEEERWKFDLLVAKTIALEEEITRSRKLEEEMSVFNIKVGRFVSGYINQPENIDLKEELTKPKKDDAVFMKIGRIWSNLLVENIGLLEELKALQEEYARLMKDNGEEEDEAEDEDEDEREEFIDIGRCVSEFVGWLKKPLLSRL